MENAASFKIVGGLLLIWLGARLVIKRSPSPEAAVAGDAPPPRAETGPGPMASFGSSFALTLTNPMTILAFAGAVASLTDETAAVPGAVSGTVVVVGVFLGSMAWWLTLVGIVSAIGSVVSQSFINAIQMLSSVILVGMGLYAIFLGGLGLLGDIPHP
jgi:threonine/homoserine/homoserine lactone efflux protein